MYPDTGIRTFIDAFSFILLLIISLYIPFVISFDIDLSSDFDNFELFIDIWFIFEIAANFFTGYYDKGLLIMSRKKIILRYLRGWFIVDIISSSPLLFLEFLDIQEHSSTDP